ncbi:DnaB-like helicase N-terminal domain-containing protein [Streptomyces maoxianensis]|uniref:DnaB-like helicase N-terminal domain-containing protein n=1 Tax=Streptomyces maoxianensis TaxID=1459942 RepID=A0ABV9GF63_9ACTN
MPRTPDPDEDDLDTIPPPQPVFYAEQALLGALLLEPQRRDDVSGLGPDAFSTAAHSALFAAIRSLPAPDPVQHAMNTCRTVGGRGGAPAGAARRVAMWARTIW